MPGNLVIDAQPGAQGREDNQRHTAGPRSQIRRETQPGIAFDEALTQGTDPAADEEGFGYIDPGFGILGISFGERVVLRFSERHASTAFHNKITLCAAFILCGSMGVYALRKRMG